MSKPSGVEPPPRTEPGKDPASGAQALAALLADQRQRWQRGERIWLETYLEQQPGLTLNTEGILDLLYNEIVLREESGEAPQLDEYLRRFPHLAAQLKTQFQVHEAIEADGLSGDATIPAEHVSLGHAGTGTVEPEVAGYQILRELGRGGMGVVYWAWQQSLNRAVALKMILAGDHAAPEMLGRFHTEAEAVARLQHPNIVQIYEVGEQQGRPYIALEFVEGGSLAQKVSGTPQSPRQAAGLSETLARAMHYAHQCHIVHRDLTPANVLLTADGTPKITDFGLAKILVGGGAGQTQSGAILGTPSYMAPEQVGNKSRSISPATDVYAIGAILYELLTGRPPFLADVPLNTVLQVVDTEPVPPHRLVPKVPADLETICLKCLEKDPRKRYMNAEALAEDLRRFLADEPIKARPSGRVEKLWRWCRRNPAVASLLATLALVLGGGLVSVTVLWLRADERRREALAAQQRAETSYRLAREALDEVVKLEDDPRFQKGPLEEVRRALLRAETTFYQKFLEQQAGDPSFQQERAKALLRLADITLAIGTVEEAIAYCRQALAICEQLARADPSAGTQVLLARSHSDLGYLFAHNNLWVEAEATYKQALQVWEKLVDDYPSERTHQVDLARTHSRLGQLYTWAGRRDQAKIALEECLRIASQLVRDHPAIADYRYNLARDHLSVGHLFVDQGQLREAEAAYQKARTILEVLARDDPNNSDYQMYLGASQGSLGNVYLGTGQTDQAEAAYEKCMKLRRKLANDHPLVSWHQFHLGLACTHMARVYLKSRCWTEAQAALEEARTIQAKLMHDEPGNIKNAANLGTTYSLLGQLADLTDKPEAAYQWYDQASVTLVPALAANPRDSDARSALCWARLGRAATLTKQGRPVEALKDLDLAGELDDGRLRTEFRLNRGKALVKLKNHKRAIAEVKPLAEDQDTSADMLYQVACVYSLSAATADADRGLAERYAASAVELLRRAFAKGSKHLEDLKKDTALDALHARGDFQKLRAELEKSVRAKSK